MASWANTTSTELGVKEQDILDLFTDKDTHDSNWRVRENWKYGASIGISGAPQVYFNGVMLESYPTSADDWETFIKALYPTPSSQNDTIKFMQ